MIANSYNRETGASGAEIVHWEDKYATKIALIDEQHKELVKLTNQLYQACLSGDVAVGDVFKDAMSRMVEYVRFHFSAEQKLLERIQYPKYNEHRKLHETLVKNILEAANDYNEGKKFVAHHFVRTLRDWVFGHIAVEDRIYSAYIMDQLKKGLLTEQQLIG